MGEDRGGWWLATLAAAAAGVCFAIAGWGAAGRFSGGGPAAAASSPAAASAPTAGLVAEGSSPFQPAPKVAAPTTVTTAAAGFADGTCLMVTSDAAGARQPVVVGCDQPHIVEVVGTVDFAKEVAVYPTAAEWAQVDSYCQAVAERYLGRPVDDASGPILRAAANRIDPTLWTTGARSASCLLGEIDPVTGAVAVRSGSLRP